MRARGVWFPDICSQPTSVINRQKQGRQPRQVSPRQHAADAVRTHHRLDRTKFPRCKTESAEQSTATGSLKIRSPRHLNPNGKESNGGHLETATKTVGNQKGSVPQADREKNSTTKKNNGFVWIYGREPYGVWSKGTENHGIGEGLSVTILLWGHKERPRMV